MAAMSWEFKSPHPHYLEVEIKFSALKLMILLKISNASELVASKLGGMVERMTPDFIDDSTVEDLVIKRMIENLANEGIRGEVSSVKGGDIQEDHLILHEGFRVRHHKKF